ncbi:hypothetical protein [Balneatrix alpica]|uniref:Uncharacterized protein n=1 Tax=Balneatrix alpica TaxID=75684 RepID=A0ABV5Z9T9_9GAMM|nr:hypothetical protein [Balneatrix alpica]
MKMTTTLLTGLLLASTFSLSAQADEHQLEIRNRIANASQSTPPATQPESHQHAPNSGAGSWH